VNCGTYLLGPETRLSRSRFLAISIASGLISATACTLSLTSEILAKNVRTRSSDVYEPLLKYSWKVSIEVSRIRGYGFGAARKKTVRGVRRSLDGRIVGSTILTEEVCTKPSKENCRDQEENSNPQEIG